jgi:predicted DNA-binding transcriptional regulator AlpA
MHKTDDADETSAVRLVSYEFLKANGLFKNRVTLARAIESYGFPEPLALGSHRIAWKLAEVTRWLDLRPRRRPKTPQPAPGRLSKRRKKMAPACGQGQVD